MGVVIAVGEEFTIVGTDVTLPVVGFTFAATFGHVPIAYTSPDTWQTLLYGDDANGRFSAVALRRRRFVPRRDRRGRGGRALHQTGGSGRSPSWITPACRSRPVS